MMDAAIRGQMASHYFHLTVLINGKHILFLQMVYNKKPTPKTLLMVLY